MAEIILEAQNVSKAFGITQAVNKVSLTFNKGEVRGLIGENGSGKSTFVSMLCGIYPLDEGKFILEGKELNIKNQVEANLNGISIIVQEMGTLSGLTVAENIFLGHEARFVKYGIKNTAAMNREASRLLNEYGFITSKPMWLIIILLRISIEVVKATYFNPKILMSDETTTALSQRGRERL